MSFPSQSPTGGEEEGVEVEEIGQEFPAPAHHPTAPSDELFDVSTTVDPSYIISLIRKLLPHDLKTSNNSHGVDAHDATLEGSNGDGMEESAVSRARNGISNGRISETEAMDTVNDCNELDGHGDDGPCEKRGGSEGEQVWEEYGCILWDLAASKTHAEFMVQNLIFEVLLASLMAFKSVRVMEICLGIIGNLACHETSRKNIASTNGLIETIVEQLFLDDTPCLCEVCRVLTLGLQGSECVTWAEALQPEHILCRILWVAENTLNPQLTEKSVGLLLAISESQKEVITILLRPFMKLGLPNLLISLLAFETTKLTQERVPERYSVLDSILRAIEALSVVDEYSQELCSNKEIFQLLSSLVKLPDKIEVANCCVTAAVSIANFMTEAADLALEISQDLSFLQGLLEIFPFASDDVEARNALWSIISQILVQVPETELNSSTLHQYVSVLVSNFDLIEEELLDHQLSHPKEEQEIPATSGGELNARTTALRRIISILSQWNFSKNSVNESASMGENHVNDEHVNRLLECCRKYARSNAGQCLTE